MGISTSSQLANGVMAGAGAATAGFSVATGSIDVIRGVAGAGLAQSRANTLDQLQASNMNQAAITGGLGDDAAGAANLRNAAGIAGQAATAQRDRRDDRLITAGKGALSVAGGAILLAAGLPNPIGLGLLAGAALIGGGVALYRWWQGRKKATGADGKPTGVTVEQQEIADRTARATELHSHRTEDPYKKILLAIGISAKKLAADKITVPDIFKALAPR